MLLVLGSLACNRQDADALARIGNRMLDRAQQSTGGMRDKLQVGIQEMGKTSVRDRVQSRLIHDRLLQGLPIEIVAHEAEIELKGMLKTADQKRRAIDLAENTEGVAKVVDSLVVPETPALP
ncbi:MAG: BON domain-containing protein [Gemmataceae bacterium]|nr:BON domain-containing protein [Gemmataceae bacterium]